MKRAGRCGATGKARYATMADAVSARQYYLSEGIALDGRTLRVFRCRPCAGWHLGNKHRKRQHGWPRGRIWS